MECAIGALLVIAIPSSYGHIYSETRCQIHTEQLPQEEVQRIKNNRKAATTLVVILIAVSDYIVSNNNCVSDYFFGYYITAWF